MVELHEIKIGSRVVVRGGFGTEQEQAVTVDGVHDDIKNGQSGIEYTEDNGAQRWAYLRQVVKVLSHDENSQEKNHADKILDVANAAYCNGECLINKDIADTMRGDGLATFIRNEIIDVCQGVESDKAALSECIKALYRANAQLEVVINAIMGEYDKLSN